MKSSARLGVGGLMMGSSRLRSVLLRGASIGSVALASGAWLGCGSDDVKLSTPDSSAVGALTPAEPTFLLPFTCREDPTRSNTPPGKGAARPTTLRQTNRAIGVAISAARLADDPVYAATAGVQFSQLTPENEMKWESIEPEQGVFDFSGADAVVEYAIAHDMKVRGHTLVWHSQLPDWVSALTGADAVRAAMTNHIQTVVGHFRDKYPGTVFSWDVVNEAIVGMGQTWAYRDDVFSREIGDTFLAEAFQIAHDADPDALLFYNDFGIEGLNGAKQTGAYTMVSALVAAGVPVQGIGFQMHTNSNDGGPGFAEFQANIQRYADLGLKVDVTEMDVSLCNIGNNAFALEAQRYRYNRIVSACFDSPACRSVSLWGLGDANSWLNDNGGCTDNMGMPIPGVAPEPLAFGDDYGRKPAWWGVYDGLDSCGYQ